MQKTLPIHFAPLQGYTDVIYRNAHAACFGGIDTYYTPFVRLEKGGFRHRDVRGIEPGNNQVPHLIPQLIAPSFEKAEKILSLLIEKGYKEVDINMGCPVKKVCNVASGSALLRNESLVASILKSVVDACAPHGVPVTLKTRTGWDHASRNALRIARMAQDIGVAAIILHGRTRCDLYQGHAEYDTIRDVKQALDIPVVANGDIDSPEKARHVLEYTGADAVMVGRAAQGRPWIFREISHYLASGQALPPPTYGELRDCLLDHLEDHYQFYGEFTGVRSARKHIGWYLSELPDADEFLPHINKIICTSEQTRAIEQWFDRHPPNEPIKAKARDTRAA